MLRHQNDEEKRLWKALSETLPVAPTMSPAGTAEEIRLLDRALHREFRQMTWWHPFFIAAVTLCALLFMFWAIRDIFTKGFQLTLLLPIIWYPFIMATSVGRIIQLKPSQRWLNGVQALLELVKYAPAEEGIRPLLTIARLDYFRVPLSKGALAPTLYHRLGEVLTRLMDFTPSAKERQFLQRVVLRPARYPFALRIAALLTLGDHPEQLDKRFRARLTDMLTKEQNETMATAARDILDRPVG